ncbi:hypothetical protein SISSUDRAFT_1043603 [Sistotremastrum suecicum HHB10207 ss-3]|uniref:F-box domain-containing protein n=1 Tax=Sistotremastrum suecicum HHB10207 ss-3 TaxID=1314776 RepID=A0A166FP74_9AGAM|nr:hypothetical protein SISSUDRAFT_1043603 [Sistotremastrum suecicum HHB10207 ss-3]
MGIPLVYQKMRADHIRSIVGFELIMNKCEGGPYDGMSRIPNVDYAEVGGVDPEDYWKMPMLQEGRFEWRTVKASKDAWILARPNIFPRFYPEVSDGRLASVAEPDETSDVLTTLPIDIIHALVSVLDMKTFIFLVSTCRTMRRYAFTSLQPYARKHVLDLPWTTPFLDSDPPEFIDSQKQAHRVDSPHDGDWLLYLSHVHRTDSMRERRRIWAICEEAKKQYVKYRQIVRQQERWPKLEAKIDKKTMNVLAAMLALRADRSRR